MTLYPRDIGIPHDTWRPNQREIYEKVRDLHISGGGTIFAELGTGSGKSAIATGLSHHTQTLTLVHTLGLLDQYKANYDWAIIKGRPEYPCVHEEKIENWRRMGYDAPTAGDCDYSPMHECPFAEECPYLLAKSIANVSRRAACTYRYAAMSYFMKTRAGLLVMDEAHDAAEELIAFNEFKIRPVTLEKYGFPMFPLTAKNFADKRGGRLNDGHLLLVRKWIEDSLKYGNNQYSAEELSSPTGTIVKRMIDRFKRTLSYWSKEEWFLSLDDEYPVLRTLSARQVAQAIMKNKQTVMLMSATIGDPAPLAHELGIEEYETISFPHPIPPQYRPIVNLRIPRMTHRNLQENPLLFDIQAGGVANFIQKLPDEWRGLILTSAYYKIKKLHERLEKSLPDRRLIPQLGNEKLSDLIQRFIDDDQNGDIAIGTIQGWGSGLDFKGELARFVVVAGVPHTNPTDLYAKARREAHGSQKYELWVTMNAIMQACGRVSRGVIDPATGEPYINYAALADGSATTKRAMSYYSDWFKDAFL